MRYFLAVLSLMAVSAQSARIGGNGERFLVLVPMVGAGTFEDPKRPAFLREAGVAFRYQLSDDGATAIAEVSPRGPLEMVKLEERNRQTKPSCRDLLLGARLEGWQRRHAG